MAYLLVGALGFAVSLAVWLPWRARHPLVIVRALLSVAMIASTGLALWAVHTAMDAARSGRAVGDAFSRIVVH